MTVPHSICVFCGSRNGILPGYAASAASLGRMLASEGWRLVYGAGDVGLMGEVARAATEAGAETFGVIPTHLIPRERGKKDLTRYIVTSNMHERKTVMFMNSDAIVVLPGGAGTLDEFFEVLTWRQIGLHKKPIFVVNIDGFWDPLIALIDNFTAQGFAADDVRDSVTVVDDIPALHAALNAAFAA